MVVVVGENILHHVKKRGNCPRGENVRGDMSEGGMYRGECPTFNKVAMDNKTDAVIKCGRCASSSEKERKKYRVTHKSEATLCDCSHL